MTARKKAPRKREPKITPIFLFGEIDDEMALAVFEAMVEIPDTARVRLVINSPGGDVGAADSIIDLIARRPVETLGTGICASAAAEILAAGIKGKRLVTPRTRIMIHHHRYGIEGSHTDHTALRDINDWMDHVSSHFWFERSTLNRVEVKRNLLRDADTWLTPEDALECGIIDGIRE